MQFTQTKDFTDDLSGLMDEIPEEEIPDAGENNTIPDNDEDDTTLNSDSNITLTDDEGLYTLGQDNDDTINK
jgi:hypothetical protein